MPVPRSASGRRSHRRALGPAALKQAHQLGLGSGRDHVGDRIEGADGQIRYILMRGKVVEWLEDGRPARLIATQSDVTARRRMENALRSSEEKYRKLFDLAQEPDSVRDRYGRNDFGQGCLLARRLVERGVRPVRLTDAGRALLGRLQLVTGGLYPALWAMRMMPMDAIRRG